MKKHIEPTSSRIRLRRPLWLLLAAVVLCALPALTLAEDRPAYLGFAPAFPKKDLPSSRKLARFNSEVDSLRQIVLDIPENGKHVTVRRITDSDSLICGDLERYLGDVSFEPAKLDGDKIPSVLPLQVRFRRGGVAPEILFPVDREKRVDDYDLYELTLRVNGIMPPRVSVFPSFHGDVSRKDSLPVYPYILVKVALDTLGQPTDITTVQSTYADFNEQIVSACNWASYEPASIGGETVASDLFLLVSFFPGADFPTRPLRRLQPDSLTIEERLMVRGFADTVGLMSKPIAYNVHDGWYSWRGNPGNDVSAGVVLCTIDTTGRGRGLRVGLPSKQLVAKYRQLVYQLRFFPALDWSGRVQPFQGSLFGEFDGSANVRVRFLWLPQDSLDALWQPIVE